ncbi:unnamed protein product [Diatraea saccharalis]|uniref:Uncharacterized protein n=1 Tax=Diatraea saccharalis TaxID=40085 RepID=A0A9N9WCT5_9NEOP|nr:unnamed protein product [Diatraea saccharalis]
MCGTVIPKTSSNREPIELQILKMELAKVKCNCNTCEPSKESVPVREDSDYSDAAIQVEKLNDPLDRFIYGNPHSPAEDTFDGQNRKDAMKYYRSDTFCPNCYFIWDLLRRFTKVFKDEECEIRPNMFSCDKSTEKDVEFNDSSTSATPKPVVSLPSNLTLCDFISETSMNTNGTTSQAKSRDNDRVKFLDDNEHDLCYLNKGPKPIPAPLHGHCFCLDNFIEAIRPPLPI